MTKGKRKRLPPGYWKDFENIKKEVNPLIDELGRFPSYKEMNRKVGSSLPRYIMKYHGGILEVAKKLGVPGYDESIGRNTQGTWTKELAVKEFLRFIDENNLDHFPSRNDLKKKGSVVMTGIIQTFTTYSSFKKHLVKSGIHLNKKEREIYWTTERIEQTLLDITNQLGHFPSQPDLNKLGFSTLRRILGENPQVSKRIQEEHNLPSKKRTYSVNRETGYWTRENVIKELDEIHSKYGRIPTQKELIQLGYGSLHTHIKSLDPETLGNYDYFKTSSHIKTYDGDMVLSVYELMFDNFLSYNDIPHKTEGLISTETDDSYRYDFLLYEDTSPTYIEIWGYDRERTELERNYVQKRRKKERLYKNLGLSLIGINPKVFDYTFQKMYDHFTRVIKQIDKSFSPKEMSLDVLLYGTNYSIEDTLNDLRKVVSTNDGFFPSTPQLRDLPGGEGLISRIQKLGGVDKMKSLLGVQSRPHKPKWSLEFLHSELQKFNDLVYIPSFSELEEHDRVDLYGGINQNGGAKQVSRLLGIPTKSEWNSKQPKVYRGKWSLEKIDSELSQIMEQIGHFPSERELKNLERHDLFVGVKRFGGMKIFRQRLNH